MTQLQAFINIISCIIGFAFIFWGLKIFKVYIILIGVALGAVIGGILGGLIWQTQEASIFSALILAIIGGIIAWPLQKLFVFLISGLIAGLLGMIIFTSMGLAPNICLVIALIFFIAGGAIAVSLYDYFVIIVMAFSGSQTIINIYTNNQLSIFGYSIYDISDVWNNIIRIYTRNIVAIVYIVVVFISFALYFQKFNAIKKSDDPKKKNNKKIFRRTSYLLALYSLVGYFLSSFLSVYFGGKIFLGISLISWPILAIITKWFICWLNEKGHKYFFTSNTVFNKIIYITIFGITVIPCITWLISSFIHLRFDPLYYYILFIKNYDFIPQMSKWIFSLIIFPGLAYLFLLKEDNSKIEEI